MGRRPSPGFPAPPGRRRPTRDELLDLMVTLEFVLTDIVHRWHDGGVPPEIRDEVNTRARSPLLRMLIRARRRPFPRSMGIP